jgi:hypothetical protein
MTPFDFLCVALGVTAAAMLASRVARVRRQRALASLAQRWRMHYSPHDVLRLSDRVAYRFPVAGAADVRVTDLVYGIEGDYHRYIFSTEFTIGVVRSKKRMARVVSFREPKGRTDPALWPEMELADESLPLVEQYDSIHKRHDDAQRAPGEGEARAEPEEPSPLPCPGVPGERARNGAAGASPTP